MNRMVFYLSLLLSLLIIIANGTGLLIPARLYAKETANWYAQCIGQDMADLFIVLPVLLISSWLAYRHSKQALTVWAGVLVYLIYTFVIYCFAVHFNELFVIYCFILGLSVYLFAWFVASQYRKAKGDEFGSKAPVKVTGIYMIVVAIVFYLFWLMQIVPANLEKTVPAELIDTGLLTNPVHALDLSVCLPGIFMTGILLLGRHSLGLLFAPVVLTFFVLMDITIGGLVLVMNWKGLAANLLLSAVMFMLALFSAALLIFFLLSVKKRG